MCNAIGQMTQIKIILTIILFSFSLVSFGHQDLISRPKTFVFIFKNKDTIKLNSSDKDKIKKYSVDIATKKIDLISAEIIFDHGERAIIKRTADKWASIKLIDDKKEVSVPVTTLNKIPEIQFETINLLWDGTYEKAFTASYFYLSFHIIDKKSNSKNPLLRLFFSDKNYTNAKVTRQIDETTCKESDF
jgi:hypothetical protein